MKWLFQDGCPVAPATEAQAEQARSRTALQNSAEGTAEGLWSGVAGGREAADLDEMIEQDAVNYPKGMCPLLGGDLAQGEVD